jgi:hypothetical protein
MCESHSSTSGSFSIIHQQHVQQQQWQQTRICCGIAVAAASSCTATAAASLHAPSFAHTQAFVERVLADTVSACTCTLKAVGVLPP